MKLINADTVVHWQSYDDEHETFPEHTGTIAEFLDAMTDEGCGESVDAVPVRHGWWEMKSDPYGFFDEIPVCSECGCTTKLREVYKFCPNCGAEFVLIDGSPEDNDYLFCPHYGAKHDLKDGDNAEGSV